MKKLLFLSVLLLALAGRARAQTAPATIAVVRIYEDRGSVKAVVTRQGRSETIQFESGASEKGLTQASEGYQKLLTLLYQEGYILESTFTTANQLGHGYITLILSKKQ